MGMLQHKGLGNLSGRPDNIPLIGVVIPTGIGMFDRHMKSESAIPTSTGSDRGYVRFAGNGCPAEASAEAGPAKTGRGGGAPRCGGASPNKCSPSAGKCNVSEEMPPPYPPPPSPSPSASLTIKSGRSNPGERRGDDIERLGEGIACRCAM